MPEYLAPGVYVEEVSFRSKSIEGVSTTTTGFVGPTRYGPVLDPPDVLTSLADFERVYGDGRPLDFGDIGEQDNYMWQAVRAFFTEGGSRLYVKRVYDGTGGVATGMIAGSIAVGARYAGAAGDMPVAFTLSAGQNVLSTQRDPVSGNTITVARGLGENDVVLIGVPAASPPGASSFVKDNKEYTFATAELVVDASSGGQVWQFTPAAASPPRPAIQLASLSTAATIQVVTLSVAVTPLRIGALPIVWPGLPLDPRHRLGGAPDSVAAVFATTVTSGEPAPIVVALGGFADGLAVLNALDSALDLTLLADPTTPPTSLTVSTVLQGGGDGVEPTDAVYEGTTTSTDAKTGLVAFEDIEDISIVAAPGSSATYLVDQDRVHAIVNGLIQHAQKMRYRIAIIDAGKGLTVQQVRAMRAQHDTNYAAFYYPWVTILDPITNQPNDMPPSGFVAGIYARNDTERAVYKAPGNEVVNLALRFERPINKAQQEVLNPEDINCFRFFEGRGYRLWGARLMSSDPEWPYVNLRRYLAFLERSIDVSTQWAVFEPNGELLWANVRSTIGDFLLEQWHEGALLGDKPEKAYFVRCDRSTMTQNDIDNGRLVCLIGVAVIRPAEFVIFRVGQWTADATK